MVSLRLAVGLLPLLAAPLAGLLPAATAEDPPCDPYPIGRCGTFQRESIVLCYKWPLPGGLFITNTEANVVVIGTNPVSSQSPVPLPQPLPFLVEYVGYLYKTPLEAFVADPMHAPLPKQFLWQEANNFPGLQRTDSMCGTFIWFAECVPAQWMGPTNEGPKIKDTMVK